MDIYAIGFDLGGEVVKEGGFEVMLRTGRSGKGSLECRSGNWALWLFECEYDSELERTTGWR